MAFHRRLRELRVRGGGKKLLSAVNKYLSKGHRGDEARFFLEVYRYDQRQWTQGIIIYIFHIYMEKSD